MTDSNKTGTAPGAPEIAPPSRPGRAQLNRSVKSAIEWVGVVVGALIVALVVKTFLIQAFYIPSESMVPTLAIGDRVLVNKLSYRDGQVDRGDIVVFARPGGPGPDGIEDLIKRVVGLPGETVEGRDGHVYIDDQLLQEPYLQASARTSTFGPEVVPAGHIWVMGDNRSASDDSRRFKAVPIDDVVGRAFVIVWPLGDVRTL